MANETEDKNENALSYMDSHFENAGIEIDDTSDGASTESGASTETSSTSDQVKGADGKDTISSDGDKAGKSGKEKEGSSVDPAKSELPAGALKLNDGTVVAPGQERRWYDNMNLARQRETIAKNDLNTATQKFTNLEAKYNTLETTVKSIGLERPEDVTAAVSLYKDLQRDVSGTLAKLLAEAKSKGYALEGLSSTVDTAAITALLDRKLEPSAGDKQRQQQEHAAAELETEIQEFVRDFPDALTHEAYIASVIDEEAKNGKILTLREAMFALKDKVINQGLDWDQPLGPQIEARKKALVTPIAEEKPRNGGRLPLGASEEIDSAKIFTPDNDTSDAIVRASMREAGLKV